MKKCIVFMTLFFVCVLSFWFWSRIWATFWLMTEGKNKLREKQIIPGKKNQELGRMSKRWMATRVSQYPW